MQIIYMMQAYHALISRVMFFAILVTSVTICLEALASLSQGLTIEFAKVKAKDKPRKWQMPTRTKCWCKITNPL